MKPERHPQRYFVTEPTPALPRRYHLLGADGRSVVQILASRPDGVEVQRPAGMRFKLPPPVTAAQVDVRDYVFQPAIHLAGRTLKCNRCHQHKLASLFPFDADGRRRTCGDCVSTRARAAGAKGRLSKQRRRAA